MKNVSQRNAPGAISAIAFTVNPVRPSVDGGFGAGEAGDIRDSFLIARCRAATTFLVFKLDHVCGTRSHLWDANALVRSSAARSDRVSLLDGMTKTRPSPRWPVRAASISVRTTSSTWQSATTMSIIISDDKEFRT